MTTVSIITPVYNNDQLTMQFLYHHWLMYETVPYIDWVIVNNGSTDRTTKYLKIWQAKMKDRLTVITNDENRGFGPANNQATDEAEGDILILINNDVTPLGDYVTPIIGELDYKPQALVGAEMLDYDTGWNVFNGRMISYLTGWCLGLRADAWAELGGFDERFVPCDYEDMDLSCRAREQGRELVTTNLPLRHQFGQTAMRLDREAITHRNRRLFAEKWGLAA